MREKDRDNRPLCLPFFRNVAKGFASADLPSTMRTDKENAKKLEAVESLLEELEHMPPELYPADCENVFSTEEHFRTMANSIPQLAWMADNTGYIFWYNRRWFEYTGTNLEEMKGWGWHTVHHVDHVERVVRKYKQHIESGEEWEDTFPLRSSSGEFRWFLSRALPIRDQSGKIVRWFGTNTDVTDQFEYEKALRESEDKLHIALKTNKCGSFEYMIGSGIVEWDQLLKDIWGVEEGEETTLDLFYEGLHPDDREHTRKAIEKSIDPRGDGHYHTTYRVINRITGDLRWIEASGQVFFEGRVPEKMIGMVIDITDRKLAEEAKELLSSIVESSDDAIVSKDLDSTINSWNKGAERLFGYTAEEAIGQPITLIIPEERLNEEEMILNRLRTGKKIEHFETVRRRKDGSLVDISVTISPIIDSEGRITGASKVARDITERKRLENSLRRAVAELKAADRHKNEFLAILGHELRNPLSALRGSVEIIERGFDRPEELARIMQSSIDTMSKLLDDLLDLSRMSQNRIEIELEPVDLEGVLEMAVAGVRKRYEEKRQDLLTAIAGPIFVEGDQTRLEQIFANLLSNACRYTPTGCEIMVRADVRDGEAVVKIRDEGVGMTRESIEKIFDPFYQVKTEGQAASGLGIGLALAKSLVDLHGGQIVASSDGIGKGSEFEVRFPAMEMPEDRFEEEAEEPEVVLKPGLKVVLVEDNEDILTTFSILLRGMQCDVRCSPNAAEGLDAIRTVEPHVALIDIGLPDMTGYEIASKLRSEGYKGKLVAVSGYSHQEARDMSKEAGFDLHIAKPAKTSEIAEILASVS